MTCKLILHHLCIVLTTILPICYNSNNILPKKYSKKANVAFNVYGYVITNACIIFNLRIARKVKMKKTMSFVLMGIFVCSLLVTEIVAETVKYSPGTRTTTEYTSEWLGLKYTLNTDMVMASDDEMNALMGIGLDLIYEDSETGAKLLDYAKINTVYDMMAVNMLNSSNVIIMAEKLLLAGMTEEQYLLAVKDQLGQVGLTITYNDTTTRIVEGIEFLELSYTMEITGMVMNQMFLVKKINDRMAILTITYFDQATLDALFAGFSAY